MKSTTLKRKNENTLAERVFGKGASRTMVVYHRCVSIENDQLGSVSVTAT